MWTSFFVTEGVKIALSAEDAKAGKFIEISGTDPVEEYLARHGCSKCNLIDANDDFVCINADCPMAKFQPKHEGK